MEATAAGDRFSYDYNNDELDELARQIAEIARRVAQIHVVFNNN